MSEDASEWHEHAHDDEARQTVQTNGCKPFGPQSMF